MKGEGDYVEVGGQLRVLSPEDTQLAALERQLSNARLPMRLPGAW
jgi:hypothetical protein